MFTALGLAQVASVTDDLGGLDPAAAGARTVLMRSSSIANAVVSARLAAGLVAVVGRKRAQCEAELEALEPVAPGMPTQWCLATRRVLGLCTCGRSTARALAHFDRRPRSAATTAHARAA